MKLVLEVGAFVLALAGALFLYAPEKISAPALEVSQTATLVEVPKREDARIFMAGDMLFDRNIRLMSGKYGIDHPFSCIDRVIKTADFAVANLEGPITINASRSTGTIPGSPDNYVFTFPTTTGALLRSHGFRAVSIGNNHILNFGYKGLISTQQNLTAAGVGYFGGVAGNEAIFETEENGVPLAFVGYNEFGGNSVAEVVNAIATEHEAGRRVIVMAHWGDEYIDSSPRLRSVAKLFAESGAAAVIGAHPHVVLDHEYIGDTLVYYSLGNFIFDQYWNTDVSHGLSLILTVKKEGRVEALEHPVEIFRDGRTCAAVHEAGF